MPFFAHRVRPPVTVENLSQVERAEDALHALGFPQVRVRHHGELARVEIAREDLPARAEPCPMLDRITATLRPIGFLYVTLDTQGYRSGSMNAVLPVTAVSAVGVGIRASDARSLSRLLCGHLRRHVSRRADRRGRAGRGVAGRSRRDEPRREPEDGETVDRSGISCTKVECA